MTASGNPTNTTLSEQYVQDCFHSYLKSSLTQAKAERLLDIDVLSSAEADIMVTGELFLPALVPRNLTLFKGPALCLYFAALRSTTNPPSVPLPRLSKNGASAPTELSLNSCPPAFRPFLIVWSQNVPAIQALAPEYQHDLARVICGLSPVAQPVNPRLNGIAADLRAVAIEISMRRTFQDRYASDLQAAIDAVGGASLRVKASFVPPPTYNAPRSIHGNATPPYSPSPRLISQSINPIPPSYGQSVSDRPPTPPPKTAILPSDAPAIEFIRETLYAALADVLERQPALRQLLARDSTRAYFAAVAFAILDVASSSYHEGREPTIYGVLGQQLTLSCCPHELKPFMAELCAIGKKMREMEEEDSLAAVEALQRDHELPPPRLDRVRDVLEGGVGYAYNDDAAGDSGRSQYNRSSSAGRMDSRTNDPRRRTTSTENRAVAFANRINSLALGMTRLRAFKERQDQVFKVLVGVTSR